MNYEPKLSSPDNRTFFEKTKDVVRGGIAWCSERFRKAPNKIIALGASAALLTACGNTEGQPGEINKSTPTATPDTTTSAPQTPGNTEKAPSQTPGELNSLDPDPTTEAPAPAETEKPTPTPEQTPTTKELDKDSFEYLDKADEMAFEFSQMTDAERRALPFEKRMGYLRAMYVYIGTSNLGVIDPIENACGTGVFLDGSPFDAKADEDINIISNRHTNMFIASAAMPKITKVGMDIDGATELDHEMSQLFIESLTEPEAMHTMQGHLDLLNSQTTVGTFVCETSSDAVEVGVPTETPDGAIQRTYDRQNLTAGYTNRVVKNFYEIEDAGNPMGSEITVYKTADRSTY